MIAVAAEDEQAAEQLGSMIDEPLERESAPSATALLVARTRARELARPFALVLDAGRSRVDVVRATDGMVLSRELEEGSATPSGMAFVAVELLALARQIEHRPPPEPPDPRMRALSVGAGAELSTIAPYAPAVRPQLELRFEAGRTDSAFGWELSLAAGLRARREVEAPFATVRAHRSDVSLRVQRSYRRARFTLLGGVLLGAAITRVDPRIEAVERRVALTAGGVLTAMVRLAGPLSLYARAVSFSSSPRRDYRVEGESVLRERPVAVDLELGLSVALHSR